jgi:pyruvate dehydrogenase E2 component (dihydrolipoamide acetyltransferase)/2-oxoglutarate dehydrogenase E2 component (dihydrolipoamide succinyltransferase)
VAAEVRLPRLGVSMTEGILSQWLVEDGDQVTAGDELYVIETDKVENEIESPVAGLVRRIGVAGETYAVGDLIAVIE